jgi:predicted nucleic acid-binding protein
LSAYVLDCSVTMAWAFREDVTPATVRLLEALPEDQALVPVVWPLEVVNVLMVAERGGRLTRADVQQFVDLLQSLPISVDNHSDRHAFEGVLPLARDTGLSAYDASYLELAMRLGLPLATLDEKLKRAAVRVGVRSIP